MFSLFLFLGSAEADWGEAMDVLPTLTGVFLLASISSISISPLLLTCFMCSILPGIDCGGGGGGGATGSLKPAN